MTLAQRLAANMASAVGGRIASAALGLATTAMMTRYLGPELFGISRTATAWAVLGCTVANFGLGYVVLREIARTGANAERIVGNALTIRIIVGIFAAVVTTALLMLIPQPNVPSTTQLAHATALAALGSIATLGNEVVTAIFQNALRQAQATIAELSGSVAMLVLVALAVHFDMGLMGIVGASTGGLLTTFIAAIGLAESITPVRFHFDTPTARMLIAIGLPVFLSETVGMVTLRLDTVALSIMSTPHEVAFYGIASKLREIANKLPVVFGAFMLPLLVRHVSNPETYEKRLRDALMAVWIFSLGMMVALWAFAEPVVQMIAGQEFLPAAPAVRAIGVALGASSMIAVLNSAAFALHRMDQVLKVHIGSAALTLVGFALLIKPLGALGAAIAVVVGEAAFAIGLLFLSAPRGLPVLPWWRFAAVVVVGLVTAVILEVAKRWNAPLYVTMPLGAVLYPGILLVTGLLQREQILAIVRKSG